MYPPRLIEVDFPVQQVSAACAPGRARERGSLTPVHLWWARKPLPACRGVLLASVFLDPASESCPPAFREVCHEVLRVTGFIESSVAAADGLAMQRGLLRLVAAAAEWGIKDRPTVIAACRTLVNAAAAALRWEGSETSFADPFAGGGSFPLEALRLGCAAYASDLNPVATVIEKATLEHAQRHGDALFSAAIEEGERIAAKLRAELGAYYPAKDSETPVAYLWFRAVRCEGPGCQATVPLASKFHLRRAGNRSIGLVLRGWDGDLPLFGVSTGTLSTFLDGTVRRGNATCLRCGFVLPVERVRVQLREQRGGSASAVLGAVVTRVGEAVTFREVADIDIQGARAAAAELERRAAEGHASRWATCPDEPLPPIGTLGFRVQRYGMTAWKDLFTPRQLLSLTSIATWIRDACSDDRSAGGLGMAVRTCLALALDRMADYLNTGCSWNPSGGSLPHLFTRQAIPVIWDFGEANPIGGATGDWMGAVRHVVGGLRNAAAPAVTAVVQQGSACHHPLPTDSIDVLVTDPPYYDAIPYADLSEFFYVWLRRSIGADYPALLSSPSVPRDEECIVNPAQGKDAAYFRARTAEAFAEARRITKPDGIGVIVFAHKSTRGWEEMLNALVDAGWIITASWPIDTENTQRLRARNSATLSSSVHLVARPRERPDGTLLERTGSWRSVLEELPGRIRAWLPRLARDGVVGADAIFACIGPALEIFSRYSRVEKASGEAVTLGEYLEQVWAAVSREALSMIFEGADTGGLEEDARLTAMWLWTLQAGRAEAVEVTPEDEAVEEEQAPAKPGSGGFALEFDAARKIAQGLGAHLDRLNGVVEVKGEQARLLSVAERARHLFVDAEAAAPAKRNGSGRSAPQLDLFAEVAAAEKRIAWGGGSIPVGGKTTLDRLHQAMVLFASGRGDVLKRFLVEDEAGKDPRIWKLAQSLSALYPQGSDERRWVDGVLARKKSLGF